MNLVHVVQFISYYIFIYVYNIYIDHVKGQPFTKVHWASGFWERICWFGHQIALAKTSWGQILYLLDLARTSLANKVHPIDLWDLWLVIEWHHEVYGSPRIFQAWIGLDSINFLVQKPPKRRISADQAVKIFPPRWWWLWDLRQCVSLTSAARLETHGTTAPTKHSQESLLKCRKERWIFLGSEVTMNKKYIYI